MYSVFIKKVSVLLVCVWCILAPVKASADTPYNNYTYTDEKAVESPAAVIPESVVTGSDMGTSDLNNPMDLFIDRKGFIYIADTNNNRILKIDSEYKLIHEYSEFINNGGEDSLLSPQGLFVDLDGNLLVADTGNQRLVKFNGNGEMIMVMQAPTSPILTDNFEYKPVKVASDIAGRIFVISKDYNRGLLELDAKGDFVQLLSAAKVTFSVTELLWRFFSTQEQLDRMASFVPTEYNNLYVDEEGFIYVTNGSITGDTPKKTTPVRKLNAKGNDVLIRNGTPVGDLEISKFGTYQGMSVINDVVSMDNGLYAILDQKRGRVFSYNSDGELLFVFGGQGATFGTVKTPSALGFYQNSFYILDSGKSSLMRYTLTDYGNLFIKAEECKANNDFTNEELYWKQILKYNQQNTLCLKKLADIYYDRRDMKQSMDYFQKARDAEGYSKAFKFYRQDIISRYFTVGAIVILALIAVIKGFSIYRKKHSKKKKKSPFKYAFYILERPFDGFWDLKREKRGNLKTALLLILFACIALVFQGQYTGFIFNPTGGGNVFIDVGVLIIPLILWISSTWCVTSLMYGEGSIKDIITATGYSVTPLIILLPIATMLSRVLVQNEGEIYYLMITVAYIWMAFLLVASIRQTHDYTMGKTIGVIFISLVVIMIIVFLFILSTALIQQMAAFFSDIYQELSLRIQ